MPIIPNSEVKPFAPMVLCLKTWKSGLCQAHNFMHIFITGVAGFLGSNLADFYLNKKFKVSEMITL